MRARLFASIATSAFGSVRLRSVFSAEPDGWRRSQTVPIWAAVTVLAVFTTAFAFILYFNLIASAGATNASLVTLLVPVSAILLGALVLGERLEPFEFAGMALIMASLIIIDGRLFRRA